jgi:hypothetical protein
MEGSEYVQIMTDPDPGGPKTYRSYGLGSSTLVTGSVSDPDPYWIRIQSGQCIRIRIRNPDPDPYTGGKKYPQK